MSARQIANLLFAISCLAKVPHHGEPHPADPETAALLYAIRQIAGIAEKASAAFVEAKWIREGLFTAEDLAALED